MTNEQIFELDETVLDEVAGGIAAQLDPNGATTDRGWGIDPNG